MLSLETAFLPNQLNNICFRRNCYWNLYLITIFPQMFYIIQSQIRMPQLRISLGSIQIGLCRTKSETIYSCICSTLPNNQITPIIFHVSPFSGIICMK